MMEQTEFLNLVWRLEELLMHRDHLNRQIGKCGGQCQSHDGDDEGLCPACCDVFMQVQQEDDRLSADTEFNDVMDKLKRACDDDKSGRYERILKQSREGKVVH
jgi:hypothetical protein